MRGSLWPPLTGVLLVAAVLFLLALACQGGGGPVGAVIVVNSTADVDARDGALSLREAILLASGGLDAATLDEGEKEGVDGAPGPDSADTISFDPEVFVQEEPESIVLGSSLPALGGSDALDASTATVIVDGDDGDFACLPIESANNSVRGLVIQNCDTAIVLSAEAHGNRIGGPGDGEGNVLSDNRVGIEVRGSGNVIQGNRIGTDASGSVAVPNTNEGIWLAPGAKDNIIGGAAAGEGNLISGNSLFGVSIDGLGTTGNVLQGNYIGTDASGSTALPNKYGIVIDGGAQDNLIGGSGPGEGNVISANNTGILLRGADTRGNAIRGNYLGTNATGDEPLPNVMDIWTTDGAADNVIEANITPEAE